MLISLYRLAYDPDTVQPQLHYLRHFMPPAAFVLISEQNPEPARVAAGAGAWHQFPDQPGAVALVVRGRD